jgi:hypothetical protein
MRLSCESCNRVWTNPQRERTAGGVSMTTGGPSDGNIKAPAVRATDCQQQLPWEAARVCRGG